MGSVPRGDAVAPFSDIDFIALVSEEPTADQAKEIAQKANELTEQFSCVSKVDLEIAVSENLIEARRFILASDSVNLWGNDSFTLPEQHLTGRKLADMLTPNLDGILSRYQETVRGLSGVDSKLLVQWSRWSGKDLLKCLRKHALLVGREYERSIPAIHRQLVDSMPEHRSLLDALYELYVRPVPDKERILSVLAMAADELPRD